VLEPDLVQWLIAQPLIAPVIGDRIHPQAASAESPRPLLVYRRVGREPFRTLDGPAKPTLVRMQFDCWGGPLATSRDIADRLRRTLDGFAGTMGTTTVHNAAVDNDVDERDDAWDEYRTTLDVVLFIDEIPIPAT
jgi:hypothetical protein